MARRNRSGKRKTGLYVRVSSEIQGEKASPEIQELDARNYAEQRGYDVVDVYRDITRYRVNGGKGKLVEPSGTRVDRPEFQRMLADARSGRIDTIIAWREDRLYRGIRPMLEVLDVLDEMHGEVTVELVTETFDMAMAPIKAAIARMELQTKNERWTMGMRGRLASGKAYATAPYGYEYDLKTERFYLNEEEARWVRFIFECYADGMNLMEISSELIKAGAPQRFRNGGVSQWSHGVIYRILRKEYYVTGKKPTEIGGQTFITELEPIIDQMLWQRCQRRIKNVRARGGNFVQRKTYSTAWLATLLKCKGHGYSMGTMSSSNGPAGNEAYCCRNKYRHTMADHPECGNYVTMGWIDRYVWNKLYSFINDPVRFEAALKERLEQLTGQQDAARADLGDLQKRLDEIEMQKVRVRKMYSKGHIDDDELDQEMILLKSEADDLEAEISMAHTDYSDDIAKVEEVAMLWRTKLADGIELLEKEPTEFTQFMDWSRTIKAIIRAIIAEVTVDADWKVTIKTHIDITKPLYSNPANQTGIFMAVEESGWEEAE